MNRSRPLGLPRVGWLALALTSVALQLWLLYSTRPPTPVTFPGADKVVHFCMFGGVAGLFLLAGARRGPVVAASLAHALISELIQWRWVAGRSGSPRDLVADSAGILFAAWLAARILGPRRGHATGRHPQG
ncbi:MULTISPECIES: VanZ family protein [unclassified Luteococcus]|uniref:VanZ family protein n=1 Tax=unclassified Luteococcus TaxID=2639923 RepID=UPI00313C9996